MELGFTVMETRYRFDVWHSRSILERLYLCLAMELDWSSGESPAGKVTIRDLPADLKASEAGDNGGKQPDRDDKGNNGNGANPQKPPSQSGAAGEDKQPAQPPKGERRKKAEETRDAILGDIKDARQKKKAELLANAAIAGVKVKKLKAKLTADNEDTACSTAFTKAGMSSGDGACVATAASSRKRRRLSSTAYDVELLFSSSTVSDDALTAAAQSSRITAWGRDVRGVRGSRRRAQDRPRGGHEQD